MNTSEISGRIGELVLSIFRMARKKIAVLWAGWLVIYAFANAGLLVLVPYEL